MPASQILFVETSPPLTNAQIKALPTTPIEIIPALGVGKSAQVIAFTFNLDATAGAYENADNSAWQLFPQGISDGLTAVCPVSFILLGIVAGPCRVVGNEAFVGSGAFDGSITVNLGRTPANTPIVLRDAFNGSDYTGGHADNTLSVGVYYIVKEV